METLAGQPETRAPSAAAPAVTTRTGPALAAAAFGAAVTGAAAVAGRYNPAIGRTAVWYRRLNKPPFTPPNWVFPVAWTPLYALIAASGYRVWRRSAGAERTRAIGLWALQLGLNAGWTPIFFGARRPKAALAEIVLLLGAVVAYSRAGSRIDHATRWMMAPYIAWVGFATVLNADIVRRNR